MTAQTANTDPRYSAQGEVSWCATLTTAAADYTGAGNKNSEIFGGEDNGGFLQRIRCKALGTNIATVLRIFINNGKSNQSIISAPGTPTGTPSAGVSGASVATGTDNRAIIVPMGVGGDIGTASAESAAVATTGPNGRILWAWTAPAGHKVDAYRVHVGIATGQQAEYFWAPQTTITASQSGTTMTVTSIDSSPIACECDDLHIGSVFASGIAAGTYIVKQLTSSEVDGALGKTGTYTLSASATVSSTSCVTDSLQYSQITPAHATATGYSHDGAITKSNNTLYGEISLPATTASATVATADIDYPMNLAIPPGYEVYVGLGTTVAAGWQITGIGGLY